MVSLNHSTWSFLDWQAVEWDRPDSSGELVNFCKLSITKRPNMYFLMHVRTGDQPIIWSPCLYWNNGVFYRDDWIFSYAQTLAFYSPFVILFPCWFRGENTFRNSPSFWSIMCPSTTNLERWALRKLFWNSAFRLLLLWAWWAWWIPRTNLANKPKPKRIDCVGYFGLVVDCGHDLLITNLLLNRLPYPEILNPLMEDRKSILLNDLMRSLGFVVVLHVICRFALIEKRKVCYSSRSFGNSYRLMVIQSQLCQQWDFANKSVMQRPFQATAADCDFKRHTRYRVFEPRLGMAHARTLFSQYNRGLSRCQTTSYAGIIRLPSQRDDYAKCIQYVEYQATPTDFGRRQFIWRT